jgi:CheY-like chemotaxis protein
VLYIVEAHGGTVKAESAGEGRGATFVVTLPVARPEPRAVVEPRAGAVGATPAAGGSLEGVRILVVDDDPDARELLVRVLGQERADVRAVASLRAALDALASFYPHLLMTDIGMPEEDGYALLRSVRAREGAAGGHLPAIAVTAFGSQADRMEALACGFDAHVAKPASPDILAELVAGLVGREAPPAPAA